MAPESYVNFRLRGLPRTFLDESRVRDLVKTVLSIVSGEGITIRSLADNPVDSESRIATLNFVSVPAQFSDRSKDEWKFDFPVQDVEGGDTASWRRPLVFDTHFRGITPLHRKPDRKCTIDLLAISGLGGHAFGSFKERDGSFMWLRDALPDDLEEARIFIYGYNTQLQDSYSFQSLDDLGTRLKDALKNMKATQKLSNPPRRFIILGHSLGGLVVKEAVVRLGDTSDVGNKEILDCISAFLFFGVPQQGMEIETLIPLVGDQPNRLLLESLSRYSTILRRQRSDFPRALSTKSPKFVAFFETLKSPTAVKIDGRWKLSGRPAVLVDIPSATHGTKEDAQYPINRNHSEIVKFSSPYDDDYLCVLGILRTMAAGNPASQKADQRDLAPKQFVTLSNFAQPSLKAKRPICVGAENALNGQTKKRKTDVHCENSVEASVGQWNEEDPIARMTYFSKLAYRAYYYISKRHEDSFKKLADVSHGLSCALDHAEKHATAIGSVEIEDPTIASQKRQLRETISACESQFDILRFIVEKLEASAGDSLDITTLIDPNTLKMLQEHSHALSFLLASETWIQTRRGALRLAREKANTRAKKREIDAPRLLTRFPTKAPVNGPAAHTVGHFGSTDQIDRGFRKRGIGMAMLPGPPTDGIGHVGLETTPRLSLMALNLPPSLSASFAPESPPIRPSTTEDPWITKLSAALDTDPAGDGSLTPKSRAFISVLGNLNVHIRQLSGVGRRQFIHRLESSSRMLNLLETAEQQFGNLQLFKKHIDYYKRQRT